MRGAKDTALRGHDAHDAKVLPARDAALHLSLLASEISSAVRLDRSLLVH